MKKTTEKTNMKKHQNMQIWHKSMQQKPKNKQKKRIICFFCACPKAKRLGIAMRMQSTLSDSRLPKKAPKDHERGTEITPSD